MSKSIYVALILMFLNQSPVLAIDLETHGSDAIVCRDPEGHIKSAELFDYYEGRVLRDISIDVGSGSKDVKSAIENLLKRLARISPLRVDDYRKGSEEFLRDAYFLSGQEFPDIEENDPVAVPIGCREEQVVLQKPKGLPGEKRYTVNKDIWDAMSEENKAGLVFHEILFAHFVPRNYDGLTKIECDGLRYFNEVLASSAELSALNTDQKIMNLFDMIKFFSTDIRGVKFAIFSAKFYPNGTLQTGRVEEKATISLYGQKVSIEGISYFDDGSIKSAEFRNDKYKDPATGRDFTYQVEFYPGGRMRKGYLAQSWEGYQDPRTGLRYDTMLTFDPSGVLLSGHVSKLSKANAYELYSAYGVSELDEKGRVTKLDGSYSSGWMAIGGYTVKCDRLAKEFRFSEDGAITRALWYGDCRVPVQNSSFKVRDESPVELKENQHVRAMTPESQSGWVELLAGSGDHVRLLKWRAQQFTSRTDGTVVYPEIRFHDGDLDILASGSLYEKTRLPLAAGGEKEFNALTWVQLNKDGEVVDWKVQSSWEKIREN